MIVMIPSIKKITLLTCLMLASVAAGNAQKKPQVFYHIELALETPEKVKILDLTSQRIQKIPVEIFQFQNLEKLVLTNCRLKALPKGIAQLKKLQTLILAFNEITSLPKELGQLTQLQKLDLYQNKLTRLPSYISALKNLRDLNVGKNQLNEFPTVLKKLTQLKRLDLNGNQLKQVPADIAWLQQNKRVFLARNPWTKWARKKLGLDDPARIHLEVPARMVPPPMLLWGHTAGKVQALRDARQGKYHLRFYGFPSDMTHTNIYMKELRKLGIKVSHEGCVVDATTESYSKTMALKIAEKFGKDYWVQPQIKADSLTNHHLPRLPQVVYHSQSVDLSHYISSQLPKKLLRKRHQDKEMTLILTIDDHLKAQQVSVLQGVSRKVDKACVALLQNARWQAPRSWLYLRKRGQVTFRATIRFR
ncbi:leucine-rich repeat domain-containing protein [Microscilla marina]|uniref:Leucine-rich repeat containing protein n=1 Tax=Microscilla marina ATCC 23134 TaxID=313606 RepID=A1ZCX5_MICM2|nr:leucine-rich repeat domain-containing protein [Microscilla marina]EAY31514.1 leucine-rich repeat containing protein [Microscilla marina ATCC 23134]